MSTHHAKIVLIGGGYAGLSAILKLADEASFELLLIDRNPTFLDLTHLHKTVHTPLQELQISYQELAEKDGFEFRCLDLQCDENTLSHWQEQGAISIPGSTIPFDYLVICIGAKSIALENTGSPGSLDLDHLKKSNFAQQLQDLLAHTGPRERTISIVGGGASGLQFLFELDDFLRLKREPHDLNFIHGGERLLSELPAGFHRHVVRKIASRKSTINYLPSTRWLTQGRDHIQVTDEKTGKQRALPSRLTLLFPGVKPSLALQTNAYGQVCLGDQVLSRVFSAGDCSHYQGQGLNTLSAQAAVRKGKLVASNICRHATDDPLLSYDYRELGYFVSLGPWDGIGWMVTKSNVLTGIPAFAVKNAIEAQFGLFLEGYDTYLGR